MLHLLLKVLRRAQRARKVREIDPDEIFLDSKNLPAFDRYQLEGRLERPISRKIIFTLGGVFLLVLLVFLSRGFALQVSEGGRYEKLSTENRLRYTLIFGERGIFTDRTGELLAWNVTDTDHPEFSMRRFTEREGLSLLLGFLKYPSKDKAGFYYQVDFEGRDGVEKYLNEYVAPQHGLRIVETDALGTITSESVLKRPRNGASVTLSVDARLSEKMYEFIEELATERGFQGGAGIMMDVATGEIVALSSFPEYDSQILTDGKNTSAINRFLADSKKPFLNRVTTGLYTPGSIVKPFVAIGALEEGIITPEKKIYSAGSISVKSPFDPTVVTVFKDWKAHGAVDMRDALAVSSDVYFYEVGGGFEDQKGLGIEAIERYMRLFGFGQTPPGNDFFGAAGVIPTPQWKKEQFNGEEWRLGNTYHTAIGQYGFQVTPLQAVRSVAALANGGKLLTPGLVKGETSLYTVVPVTSESIQVVREGMRQGVLRGTASGLNLPQVAIAAKTGTAELGASKRYVHSWVTGFFPYESPRYAFAFIMERGQRENTVGALFAAKKFIEWMSIYTPEYLKASL